MSFAFQSFGLGEFFKAQHRVSDTVRDYFVGILDAPSGYLLLGRTLQHLGDGIERLIDENSNMSSAILRNDNKLAAQQMLRVASHGLLDTLDELEQFLGGIEEEISELRWNSSPIARYRIAQTDKQLGSYHEKFAFQAWKLELLYRSLRKTNITQALSVREQVNRTIGLMLDPHGGQKSTPAIEDTQTSTSDVSASNDRLTENDLLLGLSITDVTRRLQESCQFGTGAKFFWKLKAETTLLIVLHWAHKAKLGLRHLNVVGRASLDARVNLIKAAWVLRSCCASSGSEAFYTEEVRAMLTILSCEVLYMFRRVWDKEGARTEPEPAAQNGDYSVFIDGQPLDPKNMVSQLAVNTPQTPSSSGKGLIATPQASSEDIGSSTIASPYDSTETFLEEDEIIENKDRYSGLVRKPIPGLSPPGLQPSYPGQSGRKQPSFRSSSDFELTTDTSNSSTYSQSIDVPPKSAGSSASAGSRGRSMSENVLQRDHTLTIPPPRTDLSSSFKSLSHLGPTPPPPQTARQRAGTTGSSSRKPLPAMPLPLDIQSIRDGMHKEVYYASRNPGKEVVVSPMSMLSPGMHSMVSPHPGTPAPEDGDQISQIPFSPNKRFGYSWNERVDVQALGVRPGETEVMAAEIQAMSLKASYTGDKHGRWDDCKVRIFKDTGDTNLKLRILTVQVGAEESVDQQFVDMREGELVPEYAYHDSYPVIFFRKTRASMSAFSPSVPNYPSTSLFYKFKDAHEMFTFQLAFLGESVETDCSAVRTIRYKRGLLDGEHNHYRGRIQIWHEQDANSTLKSSNTSYAPTVASRIRSNSTFKVHSTRIVMFWEESITMLFITDNVEIETSRGSRTLRIRPSRHTHFMNNPTTIKAKTIGTREISGGIPLNRRGLLFDDEDDFDDYKWFDVEFMNAEDLAVFAREFQHALRERRKQRKHAEELGRLAEKGVRAGAQVMYTQSGLKKQ